MGDQKNMSVFMNARGYVRIKIWGGSAERFLVLCSRNQILVWDILADGKYIFANMRLEDFYHCKKLARKAGIRAVVTQRHGLPFLMPKIRKRAFFIVGFILFCMMWLISTNMLLHIELRGNYSISEDVFMDFLHEQGVYIGMWKKDLEIEALEKKIRETYDIVTWTSGKLDGTILIIDLKENEKYTVEETLQTTEYGSSLYATQDGVISYIYVQYGIPLVKKGAIVEKGDLLVDGSVPIYTEDGTISDYQYYDASAEIGIETTLQVQYTLSKIYTEKQYTTREQEGVYFFVGSKIYRNKWGERKFLYKDLLLQPKVSYVLGNQTFGVGIFHTYEYRNIEKEYTLEEASTRLQQEFEKNNAILLEKGVQILEKNVTIEEIMKNWVLKGTIKVIMPAFERRLNEGLEVVDGWEGI